MVELSTEKQEYMRRDELSFSSLQDWSSGRKESQPCQVQKIDEILILSEIHVCLSQWLFAKKTVYHIFKILEIANNVILKW